MLHIAVCDKNSEGRNEIMSYIDQHLLLISKFYCKYEITQYVECENLLKQFQKKVDHPNLIYITMSPEKQKFDGISISREIRKYNKNVIIIIIGESESYLSLGYEVCAFRYLVKPLDYEKFSICLNDTLSHLRERDGIVVFMHDREKVAIRTSDIITAERVGRNLEIRMADKIYKTILTVGELETQLPLSEFIKADRGVIVNMRHIIRIEGRNVLISDGSRYAISRQRQKECFERFCEYINKTT